jgi:cleavage stimulation factor subunit 3
MEDAQGQYNASGEGLDNSDSDYEPTDNPPFVADSGASPTNSRTSTPLHPLATQSPTASSLPKSERKPVSTGFLVDEDDTPVDSAPAIKEEVNAAFNAVGVPPRSASQTPSASMPTNVSIQIAAQDKVSRSPTEPAHASSLHPSSADVLPQNPSTAITSQTLPFQQSKASSVNIQAVPKARLPHDVVGILEDRIKEDPRGDMEAWLGLIIEHRRRNKFDDVRKVYERFFKVFPTAVRMPLASVKNPANPWPGRTMGCLCVYGIAEQRTFPLRADFQQCIVERTKRSVMVRLP